MSFPGPDQNPFMAPPQFPPQQPQLVAAPAAFGPPQTQMEYLRTYNYIFENPNWFSNVALLALLMLGAIIPGVGILVQLVFQGYQFEIIDSLLRTRGTRYPDFNFNRFGEYLGRGLWPFLVSLVISVVLVPVIYGVLLVGILGVGMTASAAGDDLAPVVAIIGGTFAFLLFMAIAIGFAMLITPMLLRCGLQQDFAAAFDFAWVTDFIKKTWVEMSIGMLFMFFTGSLLAIVGMLACYIGMFATMPLVIMAQAHLLYQLYVIYLSRGGKPVPMKG